MQRDELIRKAEEGLDAFYDAMRDIHKTFNTPANDRPAPLEEFYRKRREDWVVSEVEELREAAIAEVGYDDAIIAQADAFLDISVFAMGGLVEQGVRPGKLLGIVLRSQYAKLWEDGLPRIREEDGKWIKPPTWVAPEPEMAAEIERQVKNAS